MLACIAGNTGRLLANIRPDLPGRYAYEYQQRLVPTLLYYIYLYDISSFDISFLGLPTTSRGDLTPSTLSFDLPFGLLSISCDIQLDDFFQLTATLQQCQKLPQVANVGRAITFFLYLFTQSLVFLWLSSSVIL